MPACAFCGTEVEIIDRVGRLEECSTCGRYLHCCLQCRLYDRSYHNQCRESQTAYIPDREDANFCEFFELGRDVAAERGSVSEAKKKLEHLFKR